MHTNPFLHILTAFFLSYQLFVAFALDGWLHFRCNAVTCGAGDGTCPIFFPVPQVVVVCGGKNKAVKAFLDGRNWPSNVHVHVEVSHRPSSMARFRELIFDSIALSTI